MNFLMFVLLKNSNFRAKTIILLKKKFKKFRDRLCQLGKNYHKFTLIYRKLVTTIAYW